jgi:hypothetical protein
MNNSQFEEKLVEYNQLRKQPEITAWKLRCLIKDLQDNFAERLDYLSQRLCKKNFVESGAEFGFDTHSYENAPLKVEIPTLTNPAERRMIYLANIFFTSHNWKQLADCYLDDTQHSTQWAQFRAHKTTQNVIPPHADILCNMFGEFILEEGHFESEDNRFARLKAIFNRKSQHSDGVEALTSILLDIQPKLTSLLTDKCINAIVITLSEYFKFGPDFSDKRLRSYINRCANTPLVRDVVIGELNKRFDC